MNLTKDQLEREVFRTFADARGWQGEIESRAPPEPDILFARTDGTRFAYELGEILYEPWAQAIDHSLSVPREAAFAMESMTPTARDTFRAGFNDAAIAPSFRQGLSKLKRQQAWTKILELLMSLPEQFSGSLVELGELSALLHSLTVRRFSSCTGPHFHSSAAIWIGDPTIELLQKKLGAKYAPKAPLHLLAWVGRNSMMPEWKHTASEFLAGLDPATVQFETIDVFNVNTRLIELQWSRFKQAG